MNLNSELIGLEGNIGRMQTVSPDEVTSGFHIFTGIDEDDRIVCEVKQLYEGEIVDATETIIATRDQHVRQCLIELGWMPPKK